MSTNFISQPAIQNLNLAIIPLLHPYYLYGSLQVREHYFITFSIEPYTTMDWFNIVPKNACHTLLGSPWFDANKVWYVYSFICGHKKYNLHVCTRVFLKETSESLCVHSRERQFIPQV